jgi:hypothetical protein
MKQRFGKLKDRLIQRWMGVSILAFRLSFFLRAVLPIWQSR